MDKTQIEDRAASVTGEMKAAVGTFANDARAQVEGLASQATDTAEQVYGQVRNQVRGAATTAAAAVEKQPFLAVMAVGLIGGVVGFLLARR
jgi:uncharacterized protein YjbJ (UPF0337 family)